MQLKTTNYHIINNKEKIIFYISFVSFLYLSLMNTVHFVLHFHKKQNKKKVILGLGALSNPNPSMNNSNNDAYLFAV